MANKTLEEIVNVSAAAGPFGTGDAVLEQTLRDFIQLQSNVIAVGTKLVGTRNVPWLEFKWYTGVTGTFSYPIDDNAIVDPTKQLTENYTCQLNKGMGRTTFLDSVRLRGESWETMDRQQFAIIQARADTIDNHILTNVAAGNGQTKAVGGGTAKWNGGSAADPESNILDAMDLIFANGKVSGDEPMALVLPANVRSTLLNTQLYGNVVESLQSHLGRVANLTIHYSRDYATTGTATALDQHGLLLIPGAQTAEFFQYNGEGFQETELTRLPGVGWDWLLTSYWGSVIHEHTDGASSGANNRICKLTDIIA
ncbi:MAG: hypothetical protein HOC79_08910 [Euryarchaeota archaeon]|nr:hypothetical protein [Euryarchaeota archaeon]